MYKVSKLTDKQISSLTQGVQDEIRALKNDSDNFDEELYEVFADNDKDLYDLAMAQINARPAAKPAAKPKAKAKPKVASIASDELKLLTKKMRESIKGLENIYDADDIQTVDADELLYTQAMKIIKDKSTPAEKPSAKPAAKHDFKVGDTVTFENKTQSGVGVIKSFNERNGTPLLEVEGQARPVMASINSIAHTDAEPAAGKEKKYTPSTAPTEKAKKGKSTPKASKNLSWKAPLPEEIAELASHVKMGCNVYAFKPGFSGKLDIPTTFDANDTILAVENEKGDMFVTGVYVKNGTICKTLKDAEGEMDEPEGTNDERGKSLLEQIKEVSEEAEFVPSAAKKLLKEAEAVLTDDDKVTALEIKEAAKLIDKAQDIIAEDEEDQKPKRKKKPHPEMCHYEKITRADEPLLVAVKHAIHQFEEEGGDRLVRVIYDKQDKQVMFEMKTGMFGIRTAYFDVCLTGDNPQKERDDKPTNFNILLGEDAIKNLAADKKGAHKEVRDAVITFLKECKDGCSDGEKKTFEQRIEDAKFYAKKYLLYREYMNWIHAESRKKYANGKYKTYYNAYHDTVDEMRKKHLKESKRKFGYFGYDRKRVER